MSQRHLHPPIVEDNQLCPFVGGDPGQGYQAQQTGNNCFRFPIPAWSLWTYPQYYSGADTDSGELPGAGSTRLYASIIDWRQPCGGASCTQWPDPNTTGSFAFQFTGTGARIYSNSPPFAPLNTRQSYTVSVDGGTAQNMSTSNYLLFSVEDLPDGDHIIQFDGVSSGFSVDYAVVIPGEQYHRSGQQVLANYTDEAVAYRGDWEEVPGGRKSSTVGDAVTLTFSGSIAFVRGMKENQITGDFDVAFSLDSSSPIVRTFSPNETTDDAPAQFFAASFGDNGVHNLTVSTIRFSGAQSFIFSGFTYVPDFMSVDEMPDIPAPNSTTSSDPESSDSSSSSKGAIIGGAVGGAIGGLLVIAALVFFFRRRRRTRRVDDFTLDGGDQEITPSPYRKGYVPEHNSLSPVRRAPTTPGSYSYQPVSAATAPSVMSEPDFPRSLSHAALGDALTRTTTGTGAQNGDPDPRIHHIIDIINTHYETLHQPPAYTPSQQPQTDPSRLEGSEAGGRSM